MASVPFGGLPGGLFGASESPSRSILLKRLTEERLAPNKPAVSLLDTPRLTASTILRLRSSEYASMLPMILYGSMFLLTAVGTYSVSQCSWATSGLPRLGKNEKGATTPAILHKTADQPVVQYHCITL